MASGRRSVVRRSEDVLALESGTAKPSPLALQRYLKDRSPTVRAFALDVVRRLEMKELSELVLEMLADPSSKVRYTAAECIGTLYAAERVKADWLLPLLTDPAMLVRIEALESIVQIDDKSALSLIVGLLQDRDALVRSYAAWAIAVLRGKKYVPAIRQAFRSETEEIARRGFRQALFDLGDSEQFPAILEFLSSQDYLVRCACANGIADAKLNPTQLKAAGEAIAYARGHALFRGDRTTMERVLKELRH